MKKLDSLSNLITQLKAVELSLDGYFEALSLIFKIMICFIIKIMLPPAIIIFIVVVFYQAFKLLTIHCLVRMKSDAFVLDCRKKKKEKGKTEYEVFISEYGYHYYLHKRFIVLKTGCILFLMALGILGLPFLFFNNDNIQAIAILGHFINFAFILWIICYFEEDKVYLYDDKSNKARRKCSDLVDELNKSCYTSKEQLMECVKDVVKNEPYISV